MGQGVFEKTKSMSDSERNVSQTISLEEGRDVSPERLSLLPLDHEGEAPLSAPLLGEKLAWRLAVLGVTVLAVLGAAYGSVVHRRHAQRGPAHISTQGVERKFYDVKGAYWQAPGRGISTSEVWGSCEHPHMHVCDGYCCCDADFYWKSPKTVYSQGKTILKKAAVGTVAKESHGLSATVAEEAVKHAAEALGKAAVASVTSSDQACVPRADVPNDVVESLDNSNEIPGSQAWMTCSTFTSHSHTCGDHCCCNGGFSWSASDEACAPSS